MAPTETVTLFRPVGLHEWRLIEEAACRAFPPRLPEQPIFYPVLNQSYAAQIANEWNTTDVNSGFVGIVTAFDVRAEVVAQYDVQKVGGKEHLELWVPAEQLQAFNEAIVGRIRRVEVFYGDAYEGDRDLVVDGS